MKYAVIGLGAFGSSAARQLFRKGAEVIAVDVNIDRVNSFKDEVSLVVRLDATHENALRSHGIGDVDVLIAAIGDNFEVQDPGGRPREAARDQEDHRARDDARSHSDTEGRRCGRSF